jgi:hypothetical protein
MITVHKLTNMNYSIATVRMNAKKKHFNFNQTSFNSFAQKKNLTNFEC